MNLLLASAGAASEQIASLIWVWPFVAILLAIAILPLLHKTHHWWEKNSSKLLVAVVLSIITLAYYGTRPFGVVDHSKSHGDAKTEHVESAASHEMDADTHSESADTSTDPKPAEEHAADVTEADEGEHVTQSEMHATTPEGEEEYVAEAAAHGGGHHELCEPGVTTIVTVLKNAVIAEYIPFIVLLFSLYVIAGGIVVRGDLKATPKTNTTILLIGGLLASFIGTTGAAMVLIRPLLKTNSERKHVVHTVVFFIFIVANIGGSLLPIGDPPLFLGYLRGVDFFWTLNLWPYWATAVGILLVVYFIWDTIAYSKETKKDLAIDATQITPLRIAGMINVIWILGVVVAVATLDPSKAFPGTNWHAPHFLREGVQLIMVVLSLITTQKGLRKENQFNYTAIGEVACLFIGIFITMQVPIEILNAKGSELGLTEPWQFFWATGILSSFLDNAPTYVVFFETAAAPGFPILNPMMPLPGKEISVPLLYAISCGAVFMGANSYIGNGPNFMVKSIAEQSGVKMPSFFGYMIYSAAILIPLFIVLTFIFFMGGGA